MQIEYAKNPQWVDSDQTRIDLIVKFSEFAEEIPFTAAAMCSELHTKMLFDAAVRGEYGPITEFVETVTPINNFDFPSITMRQLRLALLNMALLDTVPTAIDQIADAQVKAIIKIEWEYATTIKRTDNWIQTLANQLNLNESDLDSLFLSAASL